jgi:hypothetical protein
MEGSEIERAVKGMSLAFIQCRDYGHSWRPYSARWVPQDNAYVSELQCQRCKSVRQRFLTRTGAMAGGHYEYPDGYLVKGMGRLTGTDRDIVRLQSVLAVLVQDTTED